MAYLVMALAVLLLAGCAAPSKAHSWCAPAARYHRDTHGAHVGVRCAW
jgi:uncharacterized lipoprotein YajG